MIYIRIVKLIAKGHWQSGFSLLAARPLFSHRATDKNCRYYGIGADVNHFRLEKLLIYFRKLIFEAIDK